MYKIEIDDHEFTAEKVSLDYITGETILFARNKEEVDQQFLVRDETRLTITKINEEVKE